MQVRAGAGAGVPSFAAAQTATLAAGNAPDLIGLMVLGAVVGATAAQLTPATSGRGWRQPAAAAAGAALGVLLPGALSHMPLSAAICGGATAVAEHIARPAIERLGGARRASEVTQPLAVALALAGLLAVQLSR